ncbi:PKD domain-containing protein [Janthinobacterium sp. MDT1-19]|uniref:PKD domain-containing protein n=1 Tax=Janthinobacterium sp. MDT1-19 TaxID=1259339 RepID=UPI003F259439
MLTLPATGSYTIVMDPSGANTGSATFSLYAVPPDASGSITVGGAPVTLTTTAPGQNARLTFSGTSGQRISLNVGGISYTVSCATFSLLNPDGSALSAPSYNCASSYSLGALTLPATGSYTIVMDPSGANIASATFSLALVLPPPTADFTPSVSSGEAPLDVTFQNTSSGTATSYAWNFGDGRTSSVASPNVRFSQAGTFNVVLRATGMGGYTEATKVVTLGADVTGPALGQIVSAGVPIGATLALQQSSKLSFTATDAGGVQSVTANLSGQEIAVPNMGGGNYQLTLDPLQYANGNYVLTINTKDMLGNTSSAQVAVVINLPAPGAPTLTAPASNFKTNQASLAVSGTTALGAEAQLLLNGVGQGAWFAVAGQAFSSTLMLAEGTNQVAVQVRNNRGLSPASATVQVTLDSSKPAGPVALTAISQAQGKVRLNWMPSTDQASLGSVVYRSATAFDTAAQAVRLNASPLAERSFEDMPAADGSYYYRVASVNPLGTLSALSNSVRARADSTPPKATSILYAPAGKHDAASGRIGQGAVDLTVTVSEPMLASLFLSIVPQGGAPIPVELTQRGENTYAGRFLVDANTPSGVANALFSARDAVGNRGTDIGAGATLKIDTAGPDLSGIVLSPATPIQNDSARTVQATFSFSKAPAAAPQVKYALSGPLRTPVVLAALTQLNPNTYQGSFVLPGDAGLGGPESLSFSFQAQDDLMNVSTRVAAANRFQVYQGTLPPANVPFGLTAKAQAAGKVRLAWQAVDEATSYQLFRQAPGQGGLQALQRAGGADYTDQTAQDGAYRYAVAAVRQANGQESVSGQSAPVDVLASATAPGAPQNLALQLTGRGIYASWQPPLASTVDSYNLYRAGGSAITGIAGLNPLKSGVKTPFTYDTNPQPSAGAYVVTSVDAAGNESAISNSSYLNPSLLPVRNLKVEQIGNGLPVLSWAAPNGNVVSYQVYVGPDAGRTKLSAAPTGATTLVDTGYTGGERRYSVASVDANGVEMPRNVLLPNVAAQIAAGLPLQRGVMNRLQVQVANTSASALDGVRVVVRLPVNPDASEFKEHKSAAFALAANQTLLVPVVVAGYAGLPAAPEAQVGVEIAPNEGELVKIARPQTVAVGEGALVVGMATDAFTRGGAGKLKLTIENTSEVDVELLVATGNGKAPSSELRFKILDADGNVLATQPYVQAGGTNVVTLSNGLTVARIAAGASYVSELFTLNVPASSPNRIRVKLEVDKLRYHTGQDDELQIGGRGSEKSISLLDTAYIGEVSDVAPLSSFGDQDVLIRGRALERAGNAALPNTRLKLVLNQQGYERSFSVLTDAAGAFSYSFKPTLTDAGLYKVSAVHPDITDRPEQKAFTIHRVTVGPSPYRLDVPRNYPFPIPFVTKAGPGTTASRLRFTLDAASQPTGQLPAGVSVQLPAPVSLAERQSLNVPVQFSADNDAQPSGSLVLNVVSDEHAGASLAQVRVDYQLSQAKPYLVSTPAYLETGLAQGGSQVESFMLKNQGLQEALNLRFSLSKADGGAAPGWISIGSQAAGTLAVGASRAIDLAFTPPAGTPEGVYEFKLHIAGDNLPAQALGVYVSLSQSGKGNLLFKAADIYTATVGKDGRLVAGLANASITVQNEEVPTMTRELSTDAAGEALFQNLPAGRYQFRARAANHQEAGGRLQVKPGITSNQPVFLNYNLITVEWTVREIAIEDRYEINLNTTFETDVPAAVVLLEPASVNLPRMRAGDVYFGELTLTNYGLVRADNVTQVLPASDAMFRFEFLVEVPPVLGAKQRVTIPYRVIALQSPDAAASGANASGGGGCGGHSYSTRVSCSYVCANGATSSGGSSALWTYGNGYSGSCGGGDGGAGGVSGPGGHSTPIKMKGKKCQYVPKGGTSCEG